MLFFGILSLSLSVKKVMLSFFYKIDDGCVICVVDDGFLKLLMVMMMLLEIIPDEFAFIIKLL